MGAIHADYAERWNPATRRSHADGMRRHILPAFGERRVDAVTATDVRSWFDDFSARQAASASGPLGAGGAPERRSESTEEIPLQRFRNAHEQVDIPHNHLMGTGL